MDIITIDMETFYSKEYSLSKITTEQYIRSNEFEVIGVAVKINDEPSVWFSGTHEETAEFLRSFDYDSSVVVAHNAMFDMAILSWRFGIRPKRIADTLSMARALVGVDVGGSLATLAKWYELGEKGTEVLQAIGKHREDFDSHELAQYGEYCKNDTDLTYKLFLKLSAGFPVLEFRLIDLTIRMFTEPVLELDVAKLRAHLDAVQQRKQTLLDKVAADPKQITSNDKLAEVLLALGVTPPMKISPTTGKEAFAFAKTDEEFKALLDHEDERVQAVVAARLGVKSTLEETRTQRMLEIAARGVLPIPLRYYAAHTGRWGGSEKINMQNLPRGSALKHTIIAPKGYVIVDCDSSQIEARVLAWLAEQNDLVDAFEAGEDVYKIMASAIYNKPITDISKSERFVGKTTVLGCGYGMGAIKFQAQLKTFGVDLPEDECKRIIEVYRGTYLNIPTLWRQASVAVNAMLNDQTTPLGRDGVLVVEGAKGIRLPNGMYIKYPNLRKTGWQAGSLSAQYVYDARKGKAVIPTKIYGGKVIENVCQALARIAIGEQMLLVSKKYKVVMTVHDAIGCIIPEKETTTGQEFVEICMRVRPKWAPDLPLNCESGVGASYGDC